MGYKGQKIGKRHLSAIFPCLHSLKMLPVYCGNITYDVVTALTHCKSFRISPHCLDVVWVALSCVSGPRKYETSQISTLFPVSLTLTASIHFIYSCRPPECSGCLLNRGRSCSRGQDAVHYEMLCFLFIGCHYSFLFGL